MNITKTYHTDPIIEYGRSHLGLFEPRPVSGLSIVWSACFFPSFTSESLKQVTSSRRKSAVMMAGTPLMMVGTLVMMAGTLIMMAGTLVMMADTLMMMADTLVMMAGTLVMMVATYRKFLNTTYIVRTDSSTGAFQWRAQELALNGGGGPDVYLYGGWTPGLENL